MNARLVCRLSTIVLLAGAALPALATDSSPVVRTRQQVKVVTRAPDGRGALLMDGGKRGYLGLDLVDLTPELRRHFGADEHAGILVGHVEQDSPAERAGIEVGDVIVAIDGKAVAGDWDLRRLIAPRKAGDVVTVEVVRDGGRQQLKATLEEREGHVIEFGKLLQGADEDGAMLVMPSDEEWQKFGTEMGEMGAHIGASVAGALADPRLHMRIEERVKEREQLQRRIDDLEKRLQDLERKLQAQQRK